MLSGRGLGKSAVVARLTLGVANGQAVDGADLRLGSIGSTL